MLPFIGFGTPLVAQGRIAFFSAAPVSPTDARKVAALQGVFTPGATYVIEDSPNLLVWNRISPVLRPSSPAISWSFTQEAMLATTAFYPYPGGNWRTRRFYRVRQIAEESPAPQPPTSPVIRRGRLMEPETGKFRLTTAAGWTMMNDGSTFTLTDSTGTITYQAWGDGNIHENLNGKHLKDWFGSTRTIVIPGDTMFTLTSAYDPALNRTTLKTISIYDADQSHRIDAQAKVVLMSELLTRLGETAEADGETSRFWNTGTGGFLETIYTQLPADNDGQPRPQQSIPLGTTGGPASPNQVNDLIDDPRLGHT